MNLFKWTPLQLLFTVAFKEWWKLLNNVEYYMTCFSKHMHWMFQSEKSVFQIRWIADSCCVYWMLQMEWKINVGRRLRKWRILKSALCLNSSNLKVDQIISYITLIAKEISFSLPQKKKKGKIHTGSLLLHVNFVGRGCAAACVLFPNFYLSCYLWPAFLVYAPLPRKALGVNVKRLLQSLGCRWTFLHQTIYLSLFNQEFLLLVHL